MKRLIFTMFMALVAHCAFAQMDERFYYRDKQWVKIDSVKYSEFMLPVDKDTIYMYY